MAKTKQQGAATVDQAACRALGLHMTAEIERVIAGSRRYVP